MSGIIKMKAMNLKIRVPQKEVDKYGLAKYKCLLYDILDRYATEEYFNLDVLKE